MGRLLKEKKMRIQAKLAGQCKEKESVVSLSSLAFWSELSTNLKIETKIILVILFLYACHVWN